MTSTRRSPATGLRWIRNKGNNSTTPKSRHAFVAPKRRNLPHGARPSGRVRDPEDQAGAGHSKRHLKSIQRHHHGGADHFNGAPAAIASAQWSAKPMVHMV